MILDKNNSASSSRFKWLAALALGMAALPASAHPGHGILDYGVVHQLTSPYHVLVSLLIGFALLLTARVARRASHRIALGFGGCAFVLLAGVMLGLRSPMW